MRPANVTEQDLRQWEQDWQEYIKNNEEMVQAWMLSSLIPNYVPPDPKEVFFCGQWLGRELRALGAADSVREEICFAHGQKSMFAADDLWKMTAECMEQYKSGHWDRPGPVLAERLCREHLRKK